MGTKQKPIPMTDEVKAIVAQHKRMEKSEAAYIAERRRFRELVKDFLEEGGSATGLGRVFGVTRGRMYQHRNAWYAENS